MEQVKDRVRKSIDLKKEYPALYQSLVDHRANFRTDKDCAEDLDLFEKTIPRIIELGRCNTQTLLKLQAKLSA